MKLGEALKKNKKAFEEVSKILGWNSGGPLSVNFDLAELGDVAIYMDANENIITADEMIRLKELVPDADKITYIASDDSEADFPATVEFYYNGEENGLPNESSASGKPDGE